MAFRYFTYNGISLKDKGYMVFDVDDRSSLGTVDAADSQSNFEQAHLMNGKFQPFTSVSYNDQLIIEFSIMKDPCQLDTSNSQDFEYAFTQDEIRQLKRWLNSPIPHKLTVDDAAFLGLHWNGSFVCEDITMGGHVVGLKVSFTCVNPFGFQEEKIISGDVAGNGTIAIEDVSDEIGHLYPTVVLTLKSAGNLTLTNSFDNRITEIDNCVSGETITITSQLQISTDSTEHTNIADDFNYKFLRICNDINNTTNTITVSLPCSYKITYKPIAKAVIS